MWGCIFSRLPPRLTRGSEKRPVKNMTNHGNKTNTRKSSSTDKCHSKHWRSILSTWSDDTNKTSLPGAGKICAPYVAQFVWRTTTNRSQPLRLQAHTNWHESFVAYSLRCISAYRPSHCVTVACREQQAKSNLSEGTRPSYPRCGNPANNSSTRET